jgi:hypothetical protein
VALNTPPDILPPSPRPPPRAVINPFFPSRARTAHSFLPAPHHASPPALPSSDIPLEGVSEPTGGVVKSRARVAHTFYELRITSYQLPATCIRKRPALSIPPPSSARSDKPTLPTPCAQAAQLFTNYQLHQLPATCIRKRHIVSMSQSSFARSKNQHHPLFLSFRPPLRGCRNTRGGNQNCERSEHIFTIGPPRFPRLHLPQAPQSLYGSAVFRAQ